MCLDVVKQHSPNMVIGSISGCILVTTKSDDHLEDITCDIVPDFQLSTIYFSVVSGSGANAETIPLPWICCWSKTVLGPALKKKR